MSPKAFLVFKTIGHYLELVKFSHTIFALPFALLGLTLGFTQTQTPFELHKLLAVIACMVFARSAAMGFNRYIDARFDALNPRTAQREIPAGIVKPQHALGFIILMCVLFVATTAFINPLCLFLSPIALLVILGYSYTKRFTPLCHWVLGLGLALAPIGAYLAVTAQFATLPILLSAMVFTWVSGFDILYALQDEEFDRSHGLHSIPELLGRKNALLVSRFLHLITASIAIYIGYQYLHSAGQNVATTIFVLMLIYQHSLIKVNDISRINLAFGTTNGIASVLYATGMIVDLVL
ncbi:MAG: UbiA-like polyprenyltransferase [Chitinophagaceae bacterium]